MSDDPLVAMLYRVWGPEAVRRLGCPRVGIVVVRGSHVRCPCGTVAPVVDGRSAWHMEPIAVLDERVRVLYEEALRKWFEAEQRGGFRGWNAKPASYEEWANGWNPPKETT